MSQLSRKKTRKYLFQKLFSDTYGPLENDIFNDSFLTESYDWKIDFEYFDEMYSLIKEKEPYLLAIISKFSPKFELEKMSLTYVLPIFIWASEMLFLTEEIPAKVSINEAIELSKTFWDDSAKKIVNWVLNKLMENYEEVKEDIENIKIEKKFSFFK